MIFCRFLLRRLGWMGRSTPWCPRNTKEWPSRKKSRNSQLRFWSMKNRTSKSQSKKPDWSLSLEKVKLVARAALGWTVELARILLSKLGPRKKSAGAWLGSQGSSLPSRPKIHLRASSGQKFAKTLDNFSLQALQFFTLLGRLFFVRYLLLVIIILIYIWTIQIQ